MRKSLIEDTDFIQQRQREIVTEEGRGCQRCGTTINVERRRQNTAYEYPAISNRADAVAGDSEDPNYITLCSTCHEENDEYWKGMWADYYSSRL